MEVYIKKINKISTGGADENSEHIKLKLPVLLGRGHLLKCSNTKVSRHHAKLEYKENDVLLTSTHVNPTYAFVEGSEISLSDGQESILKPGDEFGLLKDDFWYRIDKVTTVPADQIASTSQSSTMDEDKENMETNQTILDLSLESGNSRQRELPQWMKKTSGNSSKSPKKKEQSSKVHCTQSSNEEGPSTQPVEEEDSMMEVDSPKATKASSPVKSPRKKKFKNQESETSANASMHFVSSGDESDEMESAEGEDKSKEESKAGSEASGLRESCFYGENCYRRNPSHRSEYAHPGDPDFVEPSNEVDGDDDDRPECEYGLSCYRQNPKHKKEFKHTRNVQPPRQAKKKARRKKESDLDEYDSDDSFLNDDSTDEYEPSDSDSGDSTFEPSQEDQESTMRLMKEAKRFVGKKK